MAYAIIDPAQFLSDGAFRQDEFIQKVERHDWSFYDRRRVLVRGCGSAVIPPWAFMFLAAKLAPYAKAVLYGNEHDHITVMRSAKSD